jgi:xylose isomerase
MKQELINNAINRDIKFSESQISRWHVMVVIQYLLDKGYQFDDLLFIPNISHRHESSLIHKVKFQGSKVTIFLNRFIFPFEVYSAILDNELTTEYALLQSMLKIESLLLKKHYQLLFIEFVGSQINTNTDILLARKTDFFPNSPLRLSDKITQILRAYGYIYGGVQAATEKQSIEGNCLSSSSQLGMLELGDYSQENVKQIQLKLFLREEYSEQKLGWIKQQILKDFELLSGEDRGDISVKIELFRHPFQPFSLGVNALGENKIYAQNMTVKF